MSVYAVSAAIVRPPIDHVLSHGQRTVLVCTVVGFPIPRVVWRWRQAAINIGITETVSGNSVTSRLDIVQTGAEAGGEYTCEGSNAVTRAESRVVVYGKFTAPASKVLSHQYTSYFSYTSSCCLSCITDHLRWKGSRCFTMCWIWLSSSIANLAVVINPFRPHCYSNLYSQKLGVHCQKQPHSWLSNAIP